MKSRDISVIILTYNQEATIARAIESVLAQKSQPYSFEIVIGDDCSTDSTRAICESYAARFPDVVRLMPPSANKGVVRNYFDTLAQCRGRYIADCAGDDYWLGTDRLSRQAALLDADPDVVLVHGAWEEVTANGERVRICRPYGMGEDAKVLDGSELLEPLLAHRVPLPVHLSTALYRVETARQALAADRCVVDNPDFQCEDLPLTAALLARGRVAYIPTVMLAYTVGESTVSNPRNLERAQSFYSATMKCTAILARHYGVESAALDQYFKTRAIYIAKLARKIGTPASRQLVGSTMRVVGRRMPLLARLLLIFARTRG